MAEKESIISKCLDTLDDCVTGLGSCDLPRPLLSYCLHRDCFAWEEVPQS